MLRRCLEPLFTSTVNPQVPVIIRDSMVEITMERKSLLVFIN